MEMYAHARISTHRAGGLGGTSNMDTTRRRRCLVSHAVSRVCQVNLQLDWGKTGIEIASKARSSRGFLIHVLGRLAIAMLVRSALPQSA